eukprot:CCRYP_019156-RA/>CCRYP_019156-RA protein AED:0.38 eAED:0.38 QI:0/-1/0/1/-1/1/1/0/766
MSHHIPQFLASPATNVAAIAATMTEMHNELMRNPENVVDSSDVAANSVGSCADDSEEETDDSSLRESWDSRDDESSGSSASSEDDSEASFSDDDSVSSSDDDRSSAWDDSSSSSCSHDDDDDSLELDGNISLAKAGSESDDHSIERSQAVSKSASARSDQNCHSNIHNSLLLRRRRTKQATDDEYRDKSRSLSLPRSLREADSHDNRTKRCMASRTRSNSHRHRHTNNPKQSRKRKTKQSSSLTHRFICHVHSSQCSTKLLYISFLFWTSIQLYILFGFNTTYLYHTMRNGIYYTEFMLRDTRGWSGRQKKAWMRDHARDDDYHLQRYYSPVQMEELRQRRYREAKMALGSAAEGSDEDYLVDSGNDNNSIYSGKPNTRKNKRSKHSDSNGSTRAERLREGCAELEWHSYHFPTCNDIHEIDLRGVVKNRLFGVDAVASTRRLGDDDHDKEQKSAFPWGFVGNGLWRDVFSCDPRGEVISSPGGDDHMPPAVLKMMKSEHPYDQRNFQRHRRDALVMELLSASHNLVPIYGYCANTVLTQAISHTLDDVIYAREKEKVKLWSPKGGYQTKPKLETWMGKDDNGELLATRETEIGRIRLALGVFRGLVDLHEGVGYKNKAGVPVEWLPIVHADLQAKQYLVDSTTGQIYLNDFNRCRFITKKDNHRKTANNTEDAAIPANSANTTIESCPLYIPTAPGSARSPEEYDMAPLSEKLDVYSAGNILYGIITGKRPWDDERGRHIKSYIQRGDRPKVNETIRNANGWTQN